MQDHTIATQFWRNAVEFADKPAFWDTSANHSPRSLGWGQLGELAAGWVETLRDPAAWRWPALSQIIHSQKTSEHVTREREASHGGVRVASHLRNSLDWILLDIATQTLGGIHIAIDPREPLHTAQALCKFSEADLFITQESLLSPSSPVVSRLDARSCLVLADSVAAQQPAQLLFTSGSMGTPKGVVLSHCNLLSNAQAKLDAAPQHSDDLRLNILPFAHAYARSCELSTWIVSASQLAVSKNWHDLERLAVMLRPTLMNLVPYLAERIADSLDRDQNAFGGRLRLLQVGGAALPSELWMRLQDHDLPPLQGYGLTEASPVVCSNRVGQQRPGVVGPPVCGVEVRVDSEQELWCRGPNVMLGYWNNRQATEHAIHDGWLRTGDLARIDDRGDITIIGRASEQITLSTGYKVAPEEVERELQSDPWVERAMVFGQGHPYVVALIWLAPKRPASMPANLSSDALSVQWYGVWQTRLRERLGRFPRYAQPERFFLLTDRLSSDDGLLTKKGTLSRSRIGERYRAQIAQLTQKKLPN